MFAASVIYQHWDGVCRWLKSYPVKDMEPFIPYSQYTMSQREAPGLQQQCFDTVFPKYSGFQHKRDCQFQV